MNDPRRAIPSIERLLAADEMQPLLAEEPRPRVIAALRAIQAAVRSNGSADYPTAWYVQQTAQRLQQTHSRSLRPVINATGVVLHTNLGRAPLSAAAIAAIVEAAGGYSNLEYDLQAGARGSRYEHCTNLLCELTGAEAALVVNNNAAALVLALNTFAAQRYAVVSRGELVEIGGSFRVPDIMERSGAQLREVGSTNRTHLRDYADALDDAVGAVLKVHRSNFEMTGFVSEVGIRELVELSRQHAVPLIYDAGSGLLEDLTDIGLTGEPTMRAIMSSGPDIVTLSGDKLLGGPQAGILLGSTDHIARMRANPLCRALRVDKLTIAALAATLQSYARGSARSDVPTLRMLSLDQASLFERARAFQERLRARGGEAAVESATSAVGGGAFPAAQLPTHVVVLSSEQSTREIDEKLRTGDLPVVARVVNDRMAIDLRTVAPEQEAVLLEAVLHALR